MKSWKRRIRRIIRWNAAAMVHRANKKFDGLGGHISTYASSATLYEIGFNHFFRGKDGDGLGDQVYYQGHARPACTRARSSKGASPKITCTTFGARWSAAEGFRRTRTRA